MGKRETKKFSGERVGFGVIRSGETGDKESKVGRVVVLHTEVIHHQDKSDWAGGVTEKTWGESLVEVEALEERDKTKIGQFTCFFEAVHSLLYAEDYVRLSGFVPLSCLIKGKRERRDKTAGEKRLTYILINWGEGRGDSR